MQVAPFTGLTHDEETIYSLMNQDRARAGLGPLAVHPVLNQLARAKAQDVLVNHYWDHRSPTLGSHREMVENAGVKSKATGENLMKARNAALAHGRMLANDGYSDNMFLPFYTHVGIGVVPSESGIVVCEIFVQL